VSNQKNDLSGQILGDYKLLSQIGDGGMGTVYVAEHLQYGVKYALKVLPEELSHSESFVHRFRREAGVMASLKHPHIVEVHNMSQVGDTYFLVMDYIQGPKGKPWNLENEIEARKKRGESFSEPEVLDLAGQVADALAYAHHRGVIHRDVKPSNILLDDKGRVRVVDFGLAKVVGERYLVSRIQVANPDKEEGIRERLVKTPTGAILGTFDFMSPEQKEGKESDERSDVFSFGVMLYYLLTGNKPSGLGKMPSMVARGINRRWDDLVGKCMEPNPEDRFQTVDELRRALESLSAGPVRKPILAAAVLAVLFAGVLWAALPDSFTPSRIPFLSRPTPTPTATLIPTSTPTFTPTKTPTPVPTPTPEPSGPRPKVEIRSQSPSGEVAYRDRSRVTIDFLGIPIPGGGIKEYAWRLDGGEWHKTTSQYVQFGELAAGAHRFEVKAFDYSDVPSPNVLHEFTVLDNAPPQVEWVAPVDETVSLISGDSLTVIARAEDPEGDTIAEWWWSVGSTERAPVRTQGGATGTYTWTSLAAGLQNLYVCAMDSAGKRSEWLKREVIIRYYEPTPTTTPKPTLTPTFTPHPTVTATPTPTIPPGRVEGVTIPGTNVEIEMVMVPGGSFLMGSEGDEAGRKGDEGPIRTVNIRPFWMGRYEVTQAQWQAVMGDNPSRFIAPDRPVENVSWNQCRMFIRRLNQALGSGAFRLPSEAEWEYTCRAGTSTPFSTGDTIAPDAANYDGNYAYGDGSSGQYRRKTMPVGSFAANAWGLYDMHGNVWEWCEDWHHNSYAGAPPDGEVWESPPGNSRVLRGGSWLDVPGRARSASRNWDFPDVRLSTIGFRLASDAVALPSTLKVTIGD